MIAKGLLALVGKLYEHLTSYDIYHLVGWDNVSTSCKYCP